MSDTMDVIIIGGGVIGSSTAYHLMCNDPQLKLTVVEPDPTYTQASSTLSLANIRIQFSLKENIQISQYTLDVLHDFDESMAVDDNKPNIGYRTEGNLFIVDESGQESAEKAFELQKQMNGSVDWWSPDDIKQRYPLYEIGNYKGGTFGSQDGHLDAYAFLRGFRTKAEHLGAAYIKDEVTDITTQSGRITGVQLASGNRLTSDKVVNCAGAWAAKVAQTAGVQLPIDPVKRQVFALDPAKKPESPLPLTFLPSGLYFRTETGNLIVCGKSMTSDAVGFDFTWDENRFMEILWPDLAEFVPAFDTLKLVRGWAGLYAVNRLDGNAILGEWPELEGFYLANGFSGHGLQQAPAVGRYISELILGQHPTMDLSIFNPQRIIENRPVNELGLI